ncbi:MAG TPA: zf-HC2 domain-containing protein [Thermoanaerobaculia bacterium]|nr:zf-HC2 domain-containing protein [Thermoanaerobaculia bacterium]
MREPGGIGPHVGLKRLIAYRQGALPAAEREELQEHLSLCPRCTERLLELRNFEAASARGDAAGPESLHQEAWESLAQHLPREGSTIRPIPSAARREGTRRRVPAFVSTAAAALLLAVLGFSVWAAVTMWQERRRSDDLERRLEEREQALATAQRSLAEAERRLAAARESSGREAGRVHELETRIAELTAVQEELRRSQKTPAGRDQIAAASIEVSVAPRFAVRGQENPGDSLLRGGSAVNPIPLSPSTDQFRTALSLADHPVFDEYRLVLTDREGKVLWEGRRPGPSLLGDAGTWVSLRGLGPGRYRLRIEGLHPDRRELLAEYVLDVTRTAGPAPD